MDSFTHRYNLNIIVYYERYESMHDAIAREKQLKAGPRRRKIDLINTINPTWRDLYDDPSIHEN